MEAMAVGWYCKAGSGAQKSGTWEIGVVRWRPSPFGKHKNWAEVQHSESVQNSRRAVTETLICQMQKAISLATVFFLKYNKNKNKN